eukprot:CAMPEP_0170113376 /NCGR_PEP_ID=MMETSP0020_2-20130122/9842_1 /TAXON_ID=98059 /ORGANISM="Dinobryon sp., Strain UTEXLB2267" /LENGTH=42 /DNA_ID= /DNA_START= /DNA_END= /DNA_ORIENTATION=
MAVLIAEDAADETCSAADTTDQAADQRTHFQLRKDSDGRRVE